jgi:hypothetical protein
MAGLAGRIPNFDGLLDGDQPKDTEVTIVEEAVEEDRPAAEGSKKRSRQATSGNHITMQAHWVVLRSLSSYFQTKVRPGSMLLGMAACLSCLAHYTGVHATQMKLFSLTCD